MPTIGSQQAERKHNGNTNLVEETKIKQTKAKKKENKVWSNVKDKVTKLN